MNELINDLDRVLVRKKNDDPLTKDEFRRLQLVENSLLKEVDRVCRENDIKYTIIGGTLLGAVRHKGYIPWDDDADIAMLREEYEKFKKISNQLNSNVCFFQDHETDPEYLWGYGKIRRTGTCHMRSGQDHIKCKNGVYIDVFPLDDVPNSILGQIIQDFICFVLRKILWAKVAKENTIGLARFWHKCLAKIKKETVYNILSKTEQSSNNNTKNKVRILLFPSLGKLYKKNPIKERYGMPKEWFLNLSDYEFEDSYLMGIKDYDSFLKYEYGDYMELPPEEKRIPRVSFSLIEF